LALGFLATKPSSEVLTLRVATEQVAGLAGALEQLREVSSGDRRTQLDALRGELETARSLTGSPALISELLAVALDDSGELLSSRCTELLRGSASPTQVRDALVAVSGLLDLLERIAEEAEPGGGAAVDVDRLPGDEGSGG
jgi:hypothetical protein